MTRKRVKLIFLLGVLWMALSSSITRESENYTNELAVINGKCAVQTLDKESLSAAGTVLRVFSLGTWIFESLTATVIEKGGQLVGVEMPPDSLMGMILINMSREQTSKHMKNKISEAAYDVLATDCPKTGVWHHIWRRFWNGIWMTVIYIFSYPLFFIAFPGTAIFLALRVVAKNQRHTKS